MHVIRDKSTTASVSPPEESRAARSRMPIATHLIEHVASKHGVCIRPVPLHRIDPDTGTSEIDDLPCGATTDDKCPPCAQRQQSRRKAQCRQGWHAEQESLLEPDDPTDEQQELATTGADLKRAQANALTDGEDVAPIEAEPACTTAGTRRSRVGTSGRARSRGLPGSASPLPKEPPTVFASGPVLGGVAGDDAVADRLVENQDQHGHGVLHG